MIDVLVVFCRFCGIQQLYDLLYFPDHSDARIISRASESLWLTDEEIKPHLHGLRAICHFS